MQIDVPLARFARHVPRFRGWHRLLEPLRRVFVRAYADRPERWIVIDDFERDLRMRLDRSAYMSSLIYWRGIHSFSEASLIRTYLPPDGVFLDVGANQGELTLVAARKAQRGHVFAFEPVPEWFQLLSENIALNGFGHVTAVPVALAEHEGTVEMFTSSDRQLHAGFHEGLSTFHRTEYRNIPVGQFPTTSMDAFVGARGIQRVDLIKIDVEGAEKAVLAGARSTLRRFRPMLILELNEGTFSSAGFTGAQFVASLRELGYALFDVDPFGRMTPLGERGLAEFGTLFARHEVLG